ncbi:MAG: SDR family oxidoreductase [Desulfuromonadaceae bacterium]|nr:SDR family oxidoreductase [Desulfuromonadaceae bacterium]
MQVKGKNVLVTGANGGIGSAFVKELLQRGASKVYAAARNKHSLGHLKQLDPERVVAVALDITDATHIANVAGTCSDVHILINNAGVNRGMWLTAPSGQEAARDEMEVNFFGTLAMCRAFAPVITANGGGIIANTCSLLALVNMPVIGTYCVSKAAEHSLIQGLRGEMAPKGIKVIGIYPGQVDTRMTEGADGPKAIPEQVVTAILDGLESGAEEIFPDPMSQQVHTMLLTDPGQVEKEFAKMIPA